MLRRRAITEQKVREFIDAGKEILTDWEAGKLEGAERFYDIPITVNDSPMDKHTLSILSRTSDYLTHADGEELINLTLSGHSILRTTAPTNAYSGHTGEQLTRSLGFELVNARGHQLDMVGNTDEIKKGVLHTIKVCNALVREFKGAEQIGKNITCPYGQNPRDTKFWRPAYINNDMTQNSFPSKDMRP